MITLPEKYLNFFTDFGFKKIFGEEPNKNLLQDFLNEVLKEEQGVIKDLQYLKNEQLGRLDTDRNAIFDLYCTNEKGEKFIVEIQKTKQKYFKNRSLYYATFPIQEQAPKGEWNFNFNKIYTIAILDFVFDEDEKDTKYQYNVKLTDIDNCKVFNDKLAFIYLAMPKFQKTLEECHTHYEKWLYLIKHLHTFERIPKAYQEDIFKQLFEIASVAKLDKKDYFAYTQMKKKYLDDKNTFDYAIEEATLKGEKKRTIEIAKNLKKIGMTTAQIMQTTGLSEKDIENL